MAAAELLHRLNALGITSSSHDEAFLAEGHAVDLHAALAAEGMDFNSGWLLSMSLYDCCEELLRTLRLDGLDIAYVASLLNRAAAFSARHKQDSATSWSGSIAHPDLSAASSEEGNAVRLMTIHKAKGLEARVVICPFFSSGSRGNEIWVDAEPRVLPPGGKSLPAACVSLSRDTSTRFDAERDQELESSAVDDLNILYVAFTRPKEQLFVVCPEPDDKPSYARMLKDYLEDRTDFGDPGLPCMCEEAEEEEKMKSSEYVRQLGYADWTDKVSIASPSERALTPMLEERVRFGIHAHALMATIGT